MLKPWQDFKSVEPKRRLSFSYDENLELASIDAPFDEDWARVPDLSTVPNTFNTLSSYVDNYFFSGPDGKSYEDFSAERMRSFDDAQQYALFVANDFSKAYNVCSAATSPDTLMYSPLNDDLHATFAHDDINELKANRRRAGLIIDIKDRDTPSGPVPNDLVGEPLLGTREKWANDVIENYVYKNPETSFGTLYDRARFQLALLSFYEPTDVAKDHPYNRDVVEMATASESKNSIAYNDLLRSYACIDPSVREVVAQERSSYCGYHAEQPVERFYQYEDIKVKDPQHLALATRSIEDGEIFPDPSINANIVKSGYDQARDLFNNPLFKQWFNPHDYYKVVTSALDPYVSAMSDVAKKLDPEYKPLSPYKPYDGLLSINPHSIDGFRDEILDVVRHTNDHVDVYELSAYGPTSLKDSNGFKLAKDLDRVKEIIEDINKDHESRGLPSAHLSSTRDGFDLHYQFGNDHIVKAVKNLDSTYSQSSFDLQDPTVRKQYDDLLNKSTQYFKAAALGVNPDTYKEFKESASKLNNIKPPTVSDVGLRTVPTKQLLSNLFEL